jgi:hypothetical protein
MIGRPYVDWVGSRQDLRGRWHGFFPIRAGSTGTSRSMLWCVPTPSCESRQAGHPSSVAPMQKRTRHDRSERIITAWHPGCFARDGQVVAIGIPRKSCDVRRDRLRAERADTAIALPFTRRRAMRHYGKTDEALAKLSPEQFRVTQRNGTEAPGTGPLLGNKQSGIYVDPAADGRASPSRSNGPMSSSAPTRRTA